MNIEPIVVEITRLEVQPGETLVISFPEPLSDEHLRHVSKGLRSMLPPDLPFIVSWKGVEWTVVKDAGYLGEPHA